MAKMNNDYLICPVAALVLLTGLLSCSVDPKDQPKKDVYKAPPPRIEQEQTQTDFGEWELRAHKNLDVHDTIDFTPAQARRLEVQSKCRLGDADRMARFEFASPSRIQVFEVLPDDLLAADLKAVPALCAFEWTLINAAGSKHVSNLATVSIVDTRSPEARIGPHGQESESRFRLRFSQLEGIRLRHRSTGGQAYVVCSDITVRALPFNQVLDLSLFDFKSFTLLPGHDAIAVTQNPLQLCRAVIAAEGRKVALSPLFRINFPRKPAITISSEAEFAQLHPADVPKSKAIFAGLFANQKPYKLGRIQVKNPEAVPRRFRFAKALAPTRISGFGINVYGPAASGWSTFGETQILGVRIETPGAETVHEDSSHFTVEVPPSGEFAVEFTFHPRSVLDCLTEPAPGLQGGAILSPYAARITTLPVDVDEISTDGEVLGSFALEPLPPVYLTWYEDFVSSSWQLTEKHTGPRTGGHCHWR